MILILIIITTQNSPQNRHFLFTSNKPFAIIKLGRIKEKEIVLIATIHFPPPPHPIFLSHTLFFRFTPSQQ